MRSSPTLAALLCVASLLTAQAADKPAEKPVKDTKDSAGPRADGKTSADKSKDDKDAGRKPASRINKEGKEIRVCNLRICWWTPPVNEVELALQLEKSLLPIGPAAMYLSNPVEYEGEPTVVILRKTPGGGLDKKGKPIETWEPYASFTLKPADEDLGVILFETPGKFAAVPRVFDFGLEAFPFGTMRVVNFTRSKLISTLGGAVFSAEAGASARSPKAFTQRTVTHFAVALQESGGEQHLLESSTLIFYPSFRSMYFVVELPNREVNERYQVFSVMDSKPVEIPKPATLSVVPRVADGGDKVSPVKSVSVSPMESGAKKPK